MRFNENAQPVSNDNFWSAENFARRAEQATAEQTTQQQAQHQDFMDIVGRNLVNIVNDYNVRKRPADTEKVERDFYQVFPTASPNDFRESLETLKQENVLYELQGKEGLMGTRKTSLYVL